MSLDTQTPLIEEPGVTRKTREAQLSKHRRILYTGLKPLLEEFDLMAALALWEDKYANQAQFPLRYFVEDVASLLERKIDSKRILLSLANTMAKKEEKALLPDPIDQLRTYRKSMNLNFKANRPQPEVEAFKMLVKKLLSEMPVGKAANISRFVINNIETLQIDPQIKIQIPSWIDNPNYAVRITELNVSDLRKVVNLFYISICEYIGPVQADKLMASCVSRLKANGGGLYTHTFAELL